MNALILQCFIGILVYFMVFFILGTLQKNNAIVDLAWGAGFVYAAVLAVVLQVLKGHSVDLVSWILVALVTLWGTRLSYHLFLRNHGKPEDFRYANWRREWGKWVVPRAFVQVYLLQAIMMMVISYGVLYGISQLDKKLNLLTVLGLLVWMIGFYFESTGDRQLAVFKSNPANKGRIIKSGLWRYSRHPNYFGEATLWWGILITVLSCTGNPITIISPVTITFLLLFVSGVPLLEKKYQGNAEFEDYAKITPKFFPWFPKKQP